MKKSQPKYKRASKARLVELIEEIANVVTHRFDVDKFTKSGLFPLLEDMEVIIVRDNLAHWPDNHNPLIERRWSNVTDDQRQTDPGQQGSV